MEGHLLPIYSAQFSPDGQRIASCSQDRTVNIRDVEGPLLKTLKGHLDGVLDLAYSPDGELLASGSVDSTIRLWDTSSGTSSKTLRGHSHGVSSVSWYPDGKLLASGSFDCTIRIWDVVAGDFLKGFDFKLGPFVRVSFSAIGQLIASRGDNVELWEAGLHKRSTLQGHSGFVTCVSISPTGTTAISGSVDKTVRLWDTTSRKVKHVLRGHHDPVKAVAAHPTKNIIVSGSSDGTIRLWDSVTGARLSVCRADGMVYQVAFSPNGEYVLTAARKNIQLWDIATMLQATPKNQVRTLSVALSPDGKTIAANSGHDVQTFDATSGAILKTRKAHNEAIAFIAFSRGGKFIASASRDHTVRVAATRTLIPFRTYTGHTSVVTVLVLSWQNGHCESRFTISGSSDCTVRLWDISNGDSPTVFRGHKSPIRVHKMP
jgi:WD40 repeat protein